MAEKQLYVYVASCDLSVPETDMVLAPDWAAADQALANLATWIVTDATPEQKLAAFVETKTDPPGALHVLCLGPLDQVRAILADAEQAQRGTKWTGDALYYRLASGELKQVAGEE